MLIKQADCKNDNSIEQVSYSNKSLLLASMLGVGIAIICSALYVWFTMYSAGNLYYANTNIPMFTSVDGFYYLAQAQEHLATGQGIPSLSKLVVFIHNITGFEIVSIAFYLPIVLSFLLFICYYAWGRLLSFSPLITFFAALLGSLVPAWIERSRLGWFDTDIGIALFWNICLVATAYLSLSNNRNKIISFCTLIISGLLFAWWWKPGAIILPICLGLWGITFFMAVQKKEYYLRLAVLALLAIASIVFMLIPLDFLPSIAAMQNYAISHLELVLGTSGDIMSSSIKELATLPFSSSLQNIAGHWIGGGVALIAIILFAIFYTKYFIFLLPSLFALILGCFAERFLYISALFIGLTVATMGKNIAYFIPNKHKKVSLIATVVLSLFFLICMGQWLCRWSAPIYFRQEHDVVAQALKQDAKSYVPVWNWWDDGYFLRARAGLKPLFDGGSQNSFTAHIAAKPFMTENTRFARRWIRFFSIRGIHAIQPLVAHYKSEQKAYKILEDVFMARNNRLLLQMLPPHLQEWIFPKGKVYLYFSQRILGLSYWWGALGESRNPKTEDMHSFIDYYQKENFYYNANERKLVVPEAILDAGYTAINKIYETNINPIEPPFSKDEGLFAVTSSQTNWLYLVSKRGLTSLPFRLMAPGGVEIEGFRRVSTDYNYAGAWEVLP